MNTLSRWEKSMEKLDINGFALVEVLLIRKALRYALQYENDEDGVWIDLKDKVEDLLKNKWDVSNDFLYYVDNFQ